MDRVDPEKYNLDFVKGTIYKDIRILGSNAYRDIKVSLTMGTSSDLIHYLKEYSKLLKGFNGNEQVEFLAKGIFSHVYIIKDHDGREIVIKRSHDGMIPLQLAKYFYAPIPRFLVGIFFSNFDITPISLRRDIYDYEKILKPFWGKKRLNIESSKFEQYLNMALFITDNFLPDFTAQEIHSKDFWRKLLSKPEHKKLTKLYKYLNSIETPELLIPEEERYVLYDRFSNSLQTIFIQEAMRGKEDVIPGKKMAFPFELIANGYIPKEMPKLMIEHILRSIESFVIQINKYLVPKLPDFRPLDAYKVFPPTPCEFLFAETANLVAYKNKNNKLRIVLVDTHILHDPEGDIMYRWVERRSWISLFLNLRFWIRKALDYSK